MLHIDTPTMTLRGVLLLPEHLQPHEADAHVGPNLERQPEDRLESWAA